MFISHLFFLVRKKAQSNGNDLQEMGVAESWKHANFLTHGQVGRCCCILTNTEITNSLKLLAQGKAH